MSENSDDNELNLLAFDKMEELYNVWLDEAQAGRDTIYKSLGKVEGDVIAPLLNSAFNDGPTWPGVHQAWRVIHRDNNIAFVSDGLTNPYFDEKNNVGCGVECYMEIADLPKDRETIYNNLIVRHVVNLSHQMTVLDDPKGQIATHGVLAIELYPADMGIQDISETWLNENGRTTLLLGITAPHLNTNYKIPAGDIALLTAKLLTGKEGDFVAKNGAEGRKHLVDEFAKDQSFHVNSLNRKSVV